MIATEGVRNVAVVGAGRWGANHVRTWSALGHLRIVCDPDEARLREIDGNLANVELTTSLDAVLECDQVHGVVVASPAVTHGEVAERALQAGKDVLVEKPMATSVADAERMLRSAEAHKRILMVGHVLEYHPVFVRLRELVAAGELGKVLYLYSNRLNFGRVRTEENALWSFAPHDLALFLRIVGTPPSTVSCRGGTYLSPGVADTTLMSLEFSGGVQAHVFVSWLHPYKDHRFVVVGDRKMAVFDDTAPWGKKLLLYPHDVVWEHGRVPVAHRADAMAVPVTEGEPLQAECEAFVTAMRTRVPPLTNGASGLGILELLEAGQRSLDGGGVPIAFVGRGPSGEGAIIHPTSSVHSTASIDGGASIGPGTHVWHHSHVMAAAVVGERCVLGQNVFVGNGVRIGDRVKVQNNVSVFEGVEIEDDVFCGPSMVFTNVVNPRAFIERKDEFRPTRVRRGASIGANATVVCGAEIGEYAVVGAGAVVTADVHPHALVVGVPAKQIGWVCRCGERLGVSGGVGSCRRCGERYLVDDANGRGLVQLQE
jgi:UDP-2-acetamido-3-amino-2,3-dideoxy-glucuronate N-acetyltransferase